LEFKPSVIVMDAALAKSPGLKLIRQSLPDIPVIAPTACEPAAEFPMPADMDDQLRFIRTACELYACRRQAKESAAMAQSAEGDLTKLTEVGVALSAERDLDKLLERVLEAAQDIACCNAASIYLLDDSADPNELVFKLTRNDSIELEFTENRFPSPKSQVPSPKSQVPSPKADTKN
jgi:hypothetical protein